MSWVAAAVAGGGALLGGIITGSAAKSAANTQADAANNAANMQEQNFQQTKQSLQPFVNTGYGAQTSLNNLLGIGTATDSSTYGSLLKPFDASTFQQYQDPGYQFQLQQGQQALQNSQAAKDGVLSGASLKDLLGFNQNMANTAYQNAYGRYMDTNQATYQRLSDLLGIGENAAAGVGNMGVQATNSIANTMTSGAAASAAGTMGSANALTGSINNGMGYYMLNNMTGGKLFGTGSSVPTSVINAANASSDPIASLNAGMGWTSTGP